MKLRSVKLRNAVAQIRVPRVVVSSMKLRSVKLRNRAIAMMTAILSCFLNEVAKRKASQ